MLFQLAMLAIPALFGAGLTVTSYVAPEYLRDAPFWVLHWMFWGGIALMAIMAADAILVLWWRGDLKSSAIINFGLVLVTVGFIWHYQLPAEKQYIGRKAADLAPLMQALRDAQIKNADQRQALDVMGQILTQYQRLQSSIETLKPITGRANVRDQVAANAHILAELEIARRSKVQVRRGGNGDILILKTGTNMYRITYSVPMYAVPKLTFYELPIGVIPNVVEQSNIGFTVVFVPTSTEVGIDNFQFTADAQITGG